MCRVKRQYQCLHYISNIPFFLNLKGINAFEAVVPVAVFRNHYFIITSGLFLMVVSMALLICAVRKKPKPWQLLTIADVHDSAGLILSTYISMLWRVTESRHCPGYPKWHTMTVMDQEITAAHVFLISTGHYLSKRAHFRCFFDGPCQWRLKGTCYAHF